LSIANCLSSSFPPRPPPHLLPFRTSGGTEAEPEVRDGVSF
jgi:hypothetical protein